MTDPHQHAMITHGTTRGYERGCRCSSCRQAYREALDRRSARRHGEKVPAINTTRRCARCGSLIHVGPEPSRCATCYKDLAAEVATEARNLCLLLMVDVVRDVMK